MALDARSQHRYIIRAALSGVHVFAWIFIFQYFYVLSRSIPESIGNLLLTYALTQTIAILCTPIAARRLRNGFRRSLVGAVCALAAAFAILAAAFSGGLGDIGLGVTLFAILLGIYRALYWVPYEVAAEGGHSASHTWLEVLVALVPLFTGLSLTMGPLSSVHLLYGASIVAFLSLIPLMRLRDKYEGFSWKYRETFHQLFEPAHRMLLWSSVFAGIEATALLLLWPLTVFTLVEWSYPLLGAVAALTGVFTIIARHLFRDAIHTAPARVQPLVAASGWVMRLGVSGFVGAILVDTYFQTASQSRARGLDMGGGEQAADNHTFVDEYTALKEMGMGLGRALLCVITAGLLGVLALPHALACSFAVAAVAAGLSVYYAQKEQGVF